MVDEGVEEERREGLIGSSHIQHRSGLVLTAKITWLRPSLATSAV